MTWLILKELIFFFNDTATTEIYTLSLHDALPISEAACGRASGAPARPPTPQPTMNAKSLTDWLCSALLGRPWQFLTGVDLLPAAEPVLEDRDVALDPESGDPERKCIAAPHSLYDAGGQHGMSGYHVRTVGNAPVAVPQPLTAEEKARAEGCAGAAAGGSVWNKEGGTWETRDTTAWATTRLPQLCCVDGRSAIVQLEVSGGDASVAVVRG